MPWLNIQTLLETYLGQAVDNAEHGFIAFNTAWFTDGLFVHVPAKQVLAKPIQILHIATQADVLATTRNVIIADALAEAKVIETFVGLDDRLFISSSHRSFCWRKMPI